MTIRGLDVSFWQPPDFPWAAAVAWGAKFAFIRAGGGYLEDAGYERHRANARAHGLVTGAYWALFHHNPPAYEPTIFDPLRQARAFASLLAPDDELPAVVDVEKDGVTDALLWAFVNEFHRLSERTLMIYTSQMAWYALIGRAQWRYAAYPLWVTNYNGGTLELPDAWQDAGPLFVQDSGTGDIPDYDGNLDLDTFSGSEAEFSELIGKDIPMPITLTDAQAAQIAAELDEVTLHIVQIKTNAENWLTWSTAELSRISVVRPLLVINAPPPAKHTMATLTNQQVINLFYKVFAGYGELDAVGLTAKLVAARLALYVGPAIEDLALTDAQKSRLINGLGLPVG